MFEKDPLFVELSIPKTKAKRSGLPDSNVIFFVATKKTKQKKALRCARHVWLVIAETSIHRNQSDNHATDPLFLTRPLRTSTAVTGRRWSDLTPTPTRNKTVRPPETGRNDKTSVYRKLRKLAKEYALR
jgi:hypothetical protein